MIRDGVVDRARLMRRPSRWMRRRYGRKFGEWGYKGAARKIFVEEMLLEDGEPIRLEYKFHVSRGTTAYVYAARRDQDGNELKATSIATAPMLRHPMAAAHNGRASTCQPASRACARSPRR